MPDYYQCKLYALLANPGEYQDLQFWGGKEGFEQVEQWWQKQGSLVEDLASSSDRVNLDNKKPSPQDRIEVKHPISCRSQQ